MDDLSHVHNKCDDLMAKLKALNQAAVNMPTASVVSTSPFVTPIATPVLDGTEVRNSENLSEVAAVADAVSKSLINYLTGVDTNPIAVETNTRVDSLDDQFSDKENEVVQPIEANVIINKAGICQPLKLIGEMLNELPSGKGKNTRRNHHIHEANIIVAAPVFDQCVSEYSMKSNQS